MINHSSSSGSGAPPGKESVWDYPRPPAVEPVGASVRVIVDGREIASSHDALRVIETSHPPTIYIPPGDVVMECLSAAPHRSLCEFKGQARYWDVVVGDRVIPAAAWSYPQPMAGYEALGDYLAFYPGRVDACYLGDERVKAQEGDFYGGWITSDIVGPFKGPPGTRGW